MGRPEKCSRKPNKAGSQRAITCADTHIGTAACGPGLTACPEKLQIENVQVKTLQRLLQLGIRLVLLTTFLGPSYALRTVMNDRMFRRVLIIPKHPVSCTLGFCSEKLTDALPLPLLLYCGEFSSRPGPKGYFSYKNT